MVNSGGSITTEYTYDPFGNTTTLGSQNSNVFQFTGRENEGNGLYYYYRARYYSPVLGRFISQDPLGFAGSGPNLYAYAADDPINLSDPLGLDSGDWWDPRGGYDFSHYDPWDTVIDIGNTAEAFTDALTFGSASRLNDALGAGGVLDRCGIGHKLGSAAGIVASIPLGGEALPAGLNWLPKGAKGAIGEGLSIAKNALNGNSLVGVQVKAAEAGFPNLTTTFDSVWESSSGETYYVEAKFGTGKLTPAQLRAKAALGDAYHVEKWTYPMFGQAGNYLGPAGSAAGVMAGRSCGCN